MASIVEDLMKQVTTGDNLSAISKSVGGDEKAVQSALGMGLPMIMGSMANTASQPGGADMITGMLGQMGGSNPMDNLGSFLGSPSAAGGSGMASSLLGSQMAPIQNAISQKTGLPSSVVGKVLAIAVPMVLGAVGKKFAGQKVDPKGLTSLLGDESKAAMASSPEAAGMAQQLMGAKQEAAGATGIFKKLFGK
jgi:OOP family OmpA-OmpF porin